MPKYPAALLTNLFMILLFTISSVGLATDNEAHSALHRMDIFELEIGADPQISPDGKKVAYARLAMDIMSDSVRSNIWLVDVSSRDHRPLLSGANSYASPRWSPQGDRLAYVSSAEGRGPELHVRWMDTGQTALLSNLPSTPGSLSWSPDGTQIAFSAFVETKPDPMVAAPSPPEGATWGPPVTVITSLNYRSDGRGYLDSGNSQVFVIPADGGTPRQITQGSFNHGGPLSWYPDGTQMVISANRNEDWEYDRRNDDLWSINVATGQMKQLTDRPGPDRSPVVSPDGKKVAYLGYEDKRMGYHNALVSILDLADGSTRTLTEKLDRSVDDVQWAGNSNQLYIQYDDFGKRHLGLLSMSGTVKSITDDVGSTSIGRPYTSGGFSVARNGSYAYSLGAPDRPADIAAGRRGGSPSRLTALNEDLFSHKQLGQVEAISWPSSVGDHEIYGWIVTPPGFDATKKYPFILEIHGGPFAAYGPHFSAEVQLFAAAGYVVLYTNPRGSTSYGDAFANEIHLNYPGLDYDDLMSGVDAVVGRGYVDKGQLFITGGSGGGVLTAWTVGKTDRFAAAVVAKPVINWTSMTLYSDIHTMIPRYWFDKPPWEDQENYWRRSPLSLVGNVSTPTMLLTGEADYRTPMAESEQYYQALKLRKIDSALVRVPDASHGIAARPSHLIAKVDHILAWFERYR